MKLSCFQINKVELQNKEIKAVVQLTTETTKYAYNLAVDKEGNYYFRKNWKWLDIHALEYHEKIAYKYLSDTILFKIAPLVIEVLNAAETNDRETFNVTYNKIADRMQEFY